MKLWVYLYYIVFTSLFSNILDTPVNPPVEDGGPTLGKRTRTTTQPFQSAMVDQIQQVLFFRFSYRKQKSLGCILGRFFNF